MATAGLRTGLSISSHAMVTSTGSPSAGSNCNGSVVKVLENARVTGARVVGWPRQKEQHLWWTKDIVSGRGAIIVRRSAETASGSVEVATALPVGRVIEVDKDTFWPLVREADEKLVVLDMYTQWCGPCKLMYPKVVKLSESYDDVVFMKLDCNQANKSLAKELEVKSVPTFKIFKNGKIVSEIRGAKYDELVKAINTARSAS